MHNSSFVSKLIVVVILVAFSGCAEVGVKKDHGSDAGTDTTTGPDTDTDVDTDTDTSGAGRAIAVSPRAT